VNGDQTLARSGIASNDFGRSREPEQAGEKSVSASAKPESHKSNGNPLLRVLSVGVHDSSKRVVVGSISR